MWEKGEWFLSIFEISEKKEDDFCPFWKGISVLFRNDFISFIWSEKSSTAIKRISNQKNNIFTMTNCIFSYAIIIILNLNNQKNIPSRKKIFYIFNQKIFLRRVTINHHFRIPYLRLGTHLLKRLLLNCDYLKP